MLTMELPGRRKRAQRRFVDVVKEFMKMVSLTEARKRMRVCYNNK